jgi:hypothetical protein
VPFIGSGALLMVMSILLFVRDYLIVIAKEM